MLDRRTRVHLLRAARALSAFVLTEDFVKQLEKDFRHMTKIYKAIPAEDTPEAVAMFKEARTLFNRFSSNLEELVEERVLVEPKRWDDRDWASNELNKTVRALSRELGGSRMFPEEYNNSVDKHVPAPWKLKDIRDSRIRSYQKAGRDFFIAVKEYIGRKNAIGEVPEAKDVETTDIAGFRVVIPPLHRKEKLEYDIEDFASLLHDARAKITKAGFKDAIRDLQIHLVSKDSGRGAAGSYSKETDTLIVHLVGTASFEGLYVFVHEVGHRFYFKNLSHRAKQVWDDSIDASIVPIDQEGIDLFAQKIFPLMKAKEGLRTKDFDAFVTSFVQREGVSDNLAAQLRFLGEKVGYPLWSKEVDEVLLKLSEFIGTKVPFEHITDYGETNAWEAFAEAFALYVISGPSSLRPWTRQFFKEIARSGGAQIKGQKEKS